MPATLTLSNYTYDGTDPSTLIIDRGKNSQATDDANTTYWGFVTGLGAKGWRLVAHVTAIGTFASPQEAGTSFKAFMADISAGKLGHAAQTPKFLFGFNGGPQPRNFNTGSPTDATNYPSAEGTEGSTSTCATWVTQLVALYSGRMWFEPWNEPATQFGASPASGRWFSGSQVRTTTSRRSAC